MPLLLGGVGPITVYHHAVIIYYHAVTIYCHGVTIYYHAVTIYCHDTTNDFSPSRHRYKGGKRIVPLLLGGVGPITMYHHTVIIYYHAVLVYYRAIIIYYHAGTIYCHEMTVHHLGTGTKGESESCRCS